MTDEQLAILRTVCENPEDDLPRLMLADALGDDPRAEFIRDCIFLQGWTDCPVRLGDLQSGRPLPLRCGSCDYCTARRRAEKFYAKHQWLDVPYAVAFEPTPLDGMMPTGPGPTLIVRRGFVDSIQCDWQAFLEVAEALVWFPGQTVECPKCEGSGEDRSHPARPDCQKCFKTPGRVQRPFPPTAQPISRVRLTTWPNPIDFDGSRPANTIYTDAGRFERVKCATCDGEAVGAVSDGRGNVSYPLCGWCHGRPLNSWTCDHFGSRVVFEMPEAEPVADRTYRSVTDQAIRGIAANMSIPSRIVFSTT